MSFLRGSQLFTPESGVEERTVRISGISGHASSDVIQVLLLEKAEECGAHVEDSFTYLESGGKQTVIVQVSSKTAANYLVQLNGKNFCESTVTAKVAEMTVPKAREWVQESTKPAKPTVTYSSQEYSYSTAPAYGAAPAAGGTRYSYESSSKQQYSTTSYQHQQQQLPPQETIVYGASGAGTAAVAVPASSSTSSYSTSNSAYGQQPPPQQYYQPPPQQQQQYYQPPPQQQQQYYQPPPQQQYYQAPPQQQYYQAPPQQQQQQQYQYPAASSAGVSWLPPSTSSANMTSQYAYPAAPPATSSTTSSSYVAPNTGMAPASSSGATGTFLQGDASGRHYAGASSSSTPSSSRNDPQKTGNFLA